MKRIFGKKTDSKIVMFKNYLILFIMASVLPLSKSAAQKATPLSWSVAATLMQNNKPSIGFAGMLSGVNNNVLLIAGGANFPDAMPWQGGKKYYSDKIFVLEKKGDSFVWNTKNTTTLPEPIAYPGAASTDKGVFYVGGDNEKGISSKAGLLTWNKSKQQVAYKNLPDLPVSVTAPAVCALGNTVYVVCGDQAQQSSNKFFCIDLATKQPEWKPLPEAPLALANGMAVIQNNKLYLIGGRTKSSTGISQLHSTTFVFDLKKQNWQKLADIFDGEKSTPFTASAAFAWGKNYIVLAGGDKGDVFHQIETYLSQIAKTDDATQKEKLIKDKNELVMHHQGFSTDVLLYNIKLNQWTKMGNLPVAAQVTTSASVWEGNFMLSSGEIRPGVRSPRILIGRPGLK